MRERALSRTIVLSVTILVFSLVLSGCTAPVQDSLAADWRLTINGTTEKVLTMNDLRALPAVNGHGYCVSTTGFRFGPYTCKGVDLRGRGNVITVREPRLRDQGVEAVNR